MKSVPLIILAGGFGTRLSEFTKKIPKPLIKVGGKPIIEHIIDHYAFYGVKNFIICVGYKKNFFFTYFKKIKKKKKLNIRLVDTGINSMTGDRVKKVINLIKDDFFLTYGDGLSDINIREQYKFFKKKKKIGLISCVKPEPRFGILKIKNNNVTNFIEKPIENRWINGGFFIFKNSFSKYLTGKKIILEKKPLEKLALDNKLAAFRHYGFWKCMDNLNDKKEFEKIIKSGKAKWKK